MTPGVMGTLVLWGLVATTAMAAVLQLAQGLGACLQIRHAMTGG